jgi:DDE superfamily endonuclease
MSPLEANDCVVVDETGVNIAMTRQYGRAPNGARVHTAAPVNTGKKVTVLGALSCDGRLAAMPREGRTATQGFLPLVPTILVPTVRPGQIVIRDKLSAHKVNGVKDASASVGAPLDYFPASSPDFSPIEAGWSTFTQFFRAKAARTRDR